MKINPLIKKYGKNKIWVNYSIVQSGNRKTKIPFSPITRKNASSMKPSDWSTYEEAKKVNEKQVGIVCTGDNKLFIDIDHCLNGLTIEHEEKHKIVELIIAADTYTEISPSATGLHLYLGLTGPLELEANRSGNFEAYTGGRYFTVTQNPYKEVKDVRTITPEEAIELLSLLGYPWGKQETLVADVSDNTKQEGTNKKNETISDDLVLSKMFASSTGKKIKALYDGDTSEYKNDLSSADMALLSYLAFWTGRDANAMETIWMESQLGKREKTQTREDYRRRSINAAIKNCKEIYQSKESKVKEQENEEDPLELLFNTIKGEKVFIKNTENICRILRKHPAFKDRLRYDAFKDSMEYREKEIFRPIEDHDILDIQSMISIMFVFCFASVSKQMIEDAIMKVSYENKYDSAIQYFESLVWDKTKRLETWIHRTYHTPNNEYYKKVGENWLKGLAKRACVPGSKFDYVLVLEGAQGIRKSTSLGILGACVPTDPSWHVESTMSTDNKDFFMQMRGKIIVEFSEGETQSKTEVKKMKGIITTPSDKYRPAYGRYSIDFPRRCVFAMTTNQSEYLKDDTGNRRWLPVACEGKIDTEWLEDNRDQLMAEAYHRVITLKETTYEFPDDITAEMQKSRRIRNPNEDLIADWYFNRLKPLDRQEGITVYQVYRDALHGGMVGKPMDKNMEMQISSVLKEFMNLTKDRKSINGQQLTRWFQSEASMQVAEPLPKEELDRLF